MPELPLVGVTAIIAGMAAFNRDAAAVEGGLLRIGRASDNLERQTVGAFGGSESAFGTMAASVATGATLVAGALLLGAGASIKFAADFQQGMALTQALSGATDADIAGLTTTIEDLARRGTVGMSALSEGARDLARSGVTIPEVMGGALKAVQDLTIASGGEISLDSAAKLVANSMHAFGLSVNDVDRVTTAASVVAQNSSATFTDFGTAVATAGASFKSVGFTIEDLSIAETLLTNKGISASVAATALRGEIQRLELPSKAAAKVMQDYGIHLFDASGKAVGFRDLLGQLNAAFSDEAVAAGKLTEKQRDVAVATLGLQRTGASFLVLANEGTAGFDRLAESFGRLKAADLVEIVLKPLNAQAEIAFNNIQVLAQAFGSSFLPALQESTGGLVFFLQNLKTVDAIDLGKTIVTGIQAIGSAVGSVIATIRDFGDAFGLTATAIDFLKTAAIGLGVVILATIVPPLLAGAIALGTFIVQIGLVGTAISIVSGFLATGATFVANWAQNFGFGGTVVADALRIVSDAALSVSAIFRGDFTGAALFASLAVHEFGDGLRNDAGAVLDDFGRKLDETGSAWGPWAAQAGPAGTLVQQSIIGVHQVTEALAFLLQGNFAAASVDASAALDSFHKAIQPIVDIVTGALQDALDWLVNTGWPAVQSGASVVVGFLTSQVVPKFGEVAGAINGPLQTALNWLATTGWPAITSAAGDVVAFLQGPALSAINDLSNGINGKLNDAFNWWINTGWPGLLDAARPLVDFIQTDVLPRLGRLAQAIVSDVKDAFIWMIDEGWPKLAAGGQTTADTINDPVIPALLKMAATIVDDVKPAIGGLINGGFDLLQGAAEGLGPALGKLGDYLGTTAEFAFKALDPMHNLEQAWYNLQAAAQLLQGGVTNLGLFIGDLLGPVRDAAGGIDGVKIIAALAALVLDTLILALKGVALIIEGVTAIIREAAKEFAQWAEALRVNQLAAIAFKDAFGTAFAQVAAIVTKAMGEVGATLSAYANTAGLLAAAIGGQIVSGLVGGINARAHEVASAAAAMVTSALDAARSAIGAHSPSRDFELLGNDMAEGVNIGILQNIPRAKDAARTYGDSILQELATFTDGVEKASRDIGLKLDDIVLKSATSTASAIDKANHDIQTTIDQTQDALNRLNGAEADPSSFVARENALRGTINEEKRLHNEARQDADLVSRHGKELALADSTFTKNLDLENSKFHQALAQATTDKERARLEQQHTDAIANLNIRHQDDIAAANQRFEDSKINATQQRVVDAAERDFIKQEDAKITAFKEQQLVQERDTKITTIQQAEDANVKAIQVSADKQRADLLHSYELKISDLQSALLNKIPPLTEAQAEILQQFMDNVQVETDATTQAIIDSMGQAVVAAVTDVGNTANLTLGTGGIVPRAASVTTTAFNLATGSADDLRGDGTSGVLGAKDAATQISFVLQQLDDKMPHLVAGIHDLVSAINELHDKDVTITTHHVDVYSSGGSRSAPQQAAAAVFNNAASGQPGGNGGVVVLREGGVVPGPLGVPMFAIVHGGEFVTSVNSEISKWARQMAGSQAPSSREYNYNVNATYQDTQSPASVDMDMRALVALSRGV